MSHVDAGRRSTAPQSSFSRPATTPREAAPYSRVRGGTRYTQVASTRRRRRNILIGVLATVLAVVVIGAGVAVGTAVSFYGSISSRLNENVTAETRAVLADQQASAMQLASDWTDMSPFYMLLLGVDSSESRLSGEEAESYGTGQENYRSDTMILTRIDPGNKKITLVSIHRDTIYPINGHDQKINNAYSIGGVAKTIEVISEFAGVPISHYAVVNIDGLYDIVDILGGVEVNVPYDINDWYTGWTLSAGYQTLNGEQAEIFTRSRHAYDDLGDGDRYRAAHQRLFLSALLSKVMSASPVDMVNAISAVANYVETDLELDSIISLALALRGIDAENDVYSTMNPTEAVIIDGVYYEISQDSYWHEIMRQVDAGERPDSDTAYLAVADDINNPDHVVASDADEAAGESDASSGLSGDAYVVVKSAPDYASTGSDAVSLLRANGWDAADGGEGNATLSYTAVVYEDPSYAAQAEQIAELLGGYVTEAGDVWSVSGDIMVVAAAG